MTNETKVAETIAEAALNATKPSSNRFSWNAFKQKILQLFGGLVMEKKDNAYVISIGRVAWWLAFLPAVGIWISSGGSLDAGNALKDISPNHFNILVVLAGYNMGKKVTDAAEKIFKKNDGPG